MKPIAWKVMWLIGAFALGIAGGFVGSAVNRPAPTHQESLIGCWDYSIPNRTMSNAVICFTEPR